MNKLITFAAVLVCVGASLSASARDVSFDDRLAAQKAIEQVYWDQRVWPKENPGVKPPLSAVMPDSAIRAKVEDYLAKSKRARDAGGDAPSRRSSFRPSSIA
jgi:hypothetical protein